MSFEEILAEVKSTFRSYDAAGIIDPIDLYNDYISALKQFGSLPLEIFDTVLEIKNGEALLPPGFRKLQVAVKCEPFTYKTKHKDHLQKTRFWRERHEKTSVWDSCDECCVEEKEKYIVEKFYYREYESEYYYKKPVLLTLSPAINRNYCSSDCGNFNIRNSPYEINILKGKILQTNFTTGNVFIRYYGFSTDEKGFVEVPETFNGHLEEYIINRLKTKVLERVITDGDAVTNEASLLSYYASKARDSKVKAFTELKAKGFSKKARKNYKRKLRQEMLKYEIML